MKGHPPLSNGFMIASIIGLVFTIYLWGISSTWGFLFLIIFIILFVASFISAVQAPLDSDHDIELAVHEKYGGRRYPDTELHEDNTSKYSVAQVRKKLGPKPKPQPAAKKKATKKKVAKKVASKKSVSNNVSVKKAVPKKLAKKKVTKKKR